MGQGQRAADPHSIRQDTPLVQGEGINSPIRRPSQGIHPMSEPLPDFADDAARLEWMAQVFYTGVLSDACDASGHRNRALLPDIRPLDEGRVLVGRAKTVV